MEEYQRSATIKYLWALMALFVCIGFNSYSQVKKDVVFIDTVLVAAPVILDKIEDNKAIFLYLDNQLYQKADIDWDNESYIDLLKAGVADVYLPYSKLNRLLLTSRDPHFESYYKKNAGASQTKKVVERLGTSHFFTLESESGTFKVVRILIKTTLYNENVGTGHLKVPETAEYFMTYTILAD